MKVTVTSTGLNDLRAVLESAADDAVDEGRKVVSKGALNIKTDARRFASGIAHAPHYPYAITYDTKVSGTTVSAEIGPDKAKRQGALGNFLEYGDPRTPPQAHLGPALDREGPNFVAALEKLGADLLEGR